MFIHADWASYVVGSPMIVGFTVGQMLLHPQLGPVFLVSAHLSAASDRESYQQSLNDFHQVLSKCPFEATVLCGVDANTSLKGHECDLVGPMTGSTQPVHPWKAAMLLELMCSEGLRAVNTFSYGADGDGTFRHGSHHRWGQNDYILTRGNIFTAMEATVSFFH